MELGETSTGWKPFCLSDTSRFSLMVSNLKKNSSSLEYHGAQSLDHYSSYFNHINDMPSQVSQGTRRLFTDDCLLYRVVDSVHDQVLLQRYLYTLERWAKAWGMVFNPSKCYVMSINRGRSLKPFIYQHDQLCGEILHLVLQEKYLGVTLSHDLSWRTLINMINKISQRASQKLGFIKRNLKGCPRVLKHLVYIAFVRSGLENASSIWDPHLTKDQDTLEHIQR